MNALIGFRTNAAGHLAATPTQRKQAEEAVVSNLRAKLLGQLRDSLGSQNPTTATAASTNATAPQYATAMAEGDTAVTDAAEDTLGRDAFLQLLVQQLTNQDPLEPMDNTQMVTQLAQFSALEQQQALNSNFEDLSARVDFLNGNVDQLNFISAQGMLGKYVEGFNLDQEFVGGIVESVHLEGSIVVLTVDGELVPMTGVLGVADEEPSEPIAEPDTGNPPAEEDEPQPTPEDPGDGTAKGVGS